MIRTLSDRLLRLLAVLVTALTVAISLFAWRIAAGPLPLDWLTPYIAEALSNEEEGIRVAVGGTQLRLSNEIDLVELVVLDVRATGEDDTVLAELPEVEVGLSLHALLRGMIAVARLDATAPHLSLVRREDGSIGLQGGRDSEHVGGRIELGRLLAALADAPAPGDRASYFERLEIVGGGLTLADRQSGQQLEARDAELVVQRHVDGLGGNLAFALEQVGGPAAISLTGRYDAVSGWIRFGLDFERLVPSTLASLAPDLPLEGIGLPLAGRLQGGIKADGERAPLQFELAGGPGEVELADLLMAPLPVEAVQAEGELAGDLEHLTVQRFEVSARDARLSGTAALSWPGRAVTASAEVEARNVAARDLGLFWPPRGRRGGARLGARAHHRRHRAAGAGDDQHPARRSGAAPGARGHRRGPFHVRRSHRRLLRGPAAADRRRRQRHVHGPPHGFRDRGRRHRRHRSRRRQRRDHRHGPARPRDHPARGRGAGRGARCATSWR